LNILVNNAGIGKAGNILTTNNNDWDEILKVNLTGTYLVTKHSLENLMNSKNGSIVNIASVAGIVAVKDRFAYCTSKGGVISLTKSIALDFVKENIRANAICPGTVNTPWVERITQDYDDPDEARNLMRQRQPLGRLGEPEEIAQAAIYLGSDESKFITGTTLVIDGGLTMA
jgi:NAD(P)-dependent dehydrogenase (short-subunit alcohol dehydrogenase family)